MHEAPPAGQLWPRRVVVAIVAAAGIAGVGAIELNRLPFSDRPAFALAAWPSNPDTLRDRSMQAIGLAAAQGGTVPDSARRDMHRVARLSPLSADPFAVEATIAATEGDGAKAERLFAETAARDPRSVLAQYSLADRALRTNRLDEALTHLAILVRLVPNAAAGLAGPLALYARQPGAAPTLRHFLARSPGMALPLLNELARDPAQADRAIALARSLPFAVERDWQANLIQTLLGHGEAAHAQAAWRAMNQVEPYSGLYNPQFRTDSAPAPFNWSATEGNAALVEPAPGGGLKLLYYGREDALITRQLLVLAPGRYRLAMRVAAAPGGPPGDANADSASSVRWRVTCGDGGGGLGELPINPSSRQQSLRFDVPATCRSQWLELSGKSSGFGAPVTLTVNDLAVTRDLAP